MTQLTSADKMAETLRRLRLLDELVDTKELDAILLEIWGADSGIACNWLIANDYVYYYSDGIWSIKISAVYGKDVVPLRCCVDLDGVLADFAGACAAVHGQPRPEELGMHWDLAKRWNMSYAQFWEPLTYEFWRDLPLTAEAVELMAFLEQTFQPENICILTNPYPPHLADIHHAIAGKADWLNKHFPAYRHRHMMGTSKQFCASPTTILIDDFDENVDLFVRHSGFTVLFPRPWNRNSHVAHDPLPHVKCCINNIVREHAHESGITLPGS